jgi:hypothetical protein
MMASPMTPLTIAIKEIAETKNLLATLITSSESFDYHTAKLALIELQKKRRSLAKLEAKLQRDQLLPDNIESIAFAKQRLS